MKLLSTMRLPRKMPSNITIGIDEVGRGPWAGPLVVCAVALNMSRHYEGLNDSKKLSKKKREMLSPYIKRNAAGIGIGWVDALELDSLGMTASLKLAARRAYDQLPVDIQQSAERIIIDGTMAMLDDPRVSFMPKADATVASVEAASIVAKVARDTYMMRLGKLFPGYGFASHVGYGTAAHSEALRKFGPIKGVYRYSFAPIKKLVDAAAVAEAAKHRKVEETMGRKAECVAADYLTEQGWEIVDRNWKTPECEIDIVARKGKVLNFCEVKYRENDTHGDGVAAITKTKLQQMTFASQVYQKMNPASKYFDIMISCCSLHGEPIVVDNYIDNLSLDLI